MTPVKASTPAEGSTWALFLATGAMMVSFLAWHSLAASPHGLRPDDLHRGAALVASAVLVVACLALYAFVRRVDREVRSRLP